MAIADLKRTISGKGVIQIPETFTKASRVVLYVSLRRPASSEYLNVTWNPPRKFHGNITFCIGKYVYKEYAINFDEQAFEVHESQPSQNLVSLVCVLENTLNSIYNLGEALGLNPVKLGGISGHPYLRFTPDTLRFVCYADCALDLTLSATQLVQCAEEEGQPSPPPPPPLPSEKLPPRTPVQVSAPYDGVNDDGDTVPNPIDETVGEGGLKECKVVYDYTDLLNPALSVANQESATFQILTPAEIVDVVYMDADAQSNPPNTSRSSDAVLVDANGTITFIPLVRNGVNGHEVSNLRLSCNNG